MAAGYDPTTSVLWATAASVALYFATARSFVVLRERVWNIVLALEAGGKSIVLIASLCACAQIVIGMVNLSGLGIKLTEMILGLSMGIEFLALFFTMVVCLILGMGLSTTAAYDPSAAAVTDAAVTVRTGGTAHPAVHQGNGRYSAAGFRIAAGATFDLDVTSNGHAVTAQTFVPAPARVGSSTLTQASSGSTLRSAVMPRSGETYCQSWAIRGPAGRLLTGGTCPTALEATGTGDSLVITETYGSLPLQAGDNLIEIKVTAENGIMKN